MTTKRKTSKQKNTKPPKAPTARRVDVTGRWGMLILELSQDDANTLRSLAEYAKDPTKRQRIIRDAQQHERIAATVGDCDPAMYIEFERVCRILDDIIPLRAHVGRSQHFNTAEEFYRQFIVEAVPWVADARSAAAKNRKKADEAKKDADEAKAHARKLEEIARRSDAYARRVAVLVA